MTKWPQYQKIILHCNYLLCKLEAFAVIARLGENRITNSPFLPEISDKLGREELQIIIFSKNPHQIERVLGILAHQEDPRIKWPPCYTGPGNSCRGA